MEALRRCQGFICNMDGVIYHGNRLLPGIPAFVEWLRTERGITPATGALIAPIELVIGCKAYFVGKPNPLIMCHALKRLGCQREETVIVGDRMDTDIVAGVESEITTVLVLSGVTRREDRPHFAYRPDYVLDGAFQMSATG